MTLRHLGLLFLIKKQAREYTSLTQGYSVDAVFEGSDGAPGGRDGEFGGIARREWLIFTKRA